MYIENTTIFALFITSIWIP